MSSDDQVTPVVLELDEEDEEDTEPEEISEVDDEVAAAMATEPLVEEDEATQQPSSSSSSSSSSATNAGEGDDAQRSKAYNLHARPNQRLQYSGMSESPVHSKSFSLPDVNDTEPMAPSDITKRDRNGTEVAQLTTDDFAQLSKDTLEKLYQHAADLLALHVQQNYDQLVQASEEGVEVAQVPDISINMLTRDDEASNVPKLKSWLLSNLLVTLPATTMTLEKQMEELQADETIATESLHEADYALLLDLVCRELRKVLVSLSEAAIEAVLFTLESVQNVEDKEHFSQLGRRLSRLYRRARLFNSITRKLFPNDPERHQVSVARMYHGVVITLLSKGVISKATQDRFDADLERNSAWIWDPSEPKSRHYMHLQMMMDDFVLPVQMLDKFPYKVYDGEWGLWAIVEAYAGMVIDVSLKWVNCFAQSASSMANTEEWRASFEELTQIDVNTALTWLHDKEREVDHEMEHVLQKLMDFSPFLMKINTLYVVSNSVSKYLNQVLDRYRAKMEQSEDGQAAIKSIERQITVARRSIQMKMTDLLCFLYEATVSGLESVLVDMLKTKWSISNLFSDKEDKKQYSWDMVSQVVLPVITYLDSSVIWIIEPLYNEVFTQLFEMLWKSTVRTLGKIVLGEHEDIKEVQEKQNSIITALLSPEYTFSLSRYFDAEGKGVAMERLERDRKRILKCLEWNTADTEIVVADLKESQERLVALDETQEAQRSHERVLLEAGIKILTQRKGDAKASAFVDSVEVDSGNERA